MRPTIELTIDKIVVEGLSPGERRRFGRCVERELRQMLLKQDPSIAEGRSVDGVNAGSFCVEPGFSTESLGRAVARCVAGVLRR